MPVDRRRHALARALHAARLLGVVALGWVLVSQAVRPQLVQVDPQQWAGTQQGNTVVTTSPAGDAFHGWAGPSEIWLELDSEGRIQRAKIAQSADSASFLARIAEDAKFLSSLKGLTVEQAADWSVDAVSGATLSSRAIQSAVRARFLGEPLASPFGPLADDEQQTPEGGFILRAEPIPGVGFQGPTDAVLAFDAEGRSVKLRILESFDNQRWVEDIGFEPSYSRSLIGLTVDELAALEVGSTGVEGVSGATMTSQGIVLALQAAARTKLRTNDGDSAPAMTVVRTPMELLGWMLGGAALLILLSPLRRRRNVRRGLRIAVMLGFGFGAGALLSLDSAWAWAQHGLPWQSAPLLAGFVLASVLGSAVLGRKTYCRSLCAHGAMQQLLATRARHSLPTKLDQVLRKLPGLLLVLAVGVLAVGAMDELASWEPFAAWTPQAASRISLVLALASMVAARFVPLSYCHYACPTGALLDYLRYQPRQLAKRADLGLLLLMGIAAIAPD